MKKIKGLVATLLAVVGCVAFTGCAELQGLLDEWGLGGLLGDLGLTSSSQSSSAQSSSLQSSSLQSSSAQSSSSQSSSSIQMGGGDITAGAGNLTADEIQEITTSKLSVHFLELGNKYTGDCTLIKVGNTEVLIDAGSRKGSAGTIVPYVQNYCTDGVLEYVVATHAHQDHIAGFVGTNDHPGVLESFVCQTIIDYPLTNATSVIRSDYEELRSAEVQSGATHYTALQCYNQTDGANRTYTLGEGVQMHILYQKFYEIQTSDENDYSVCLLISAGEDNYLFTGDLEKEGEASLVESNALPKCVLFKGGHHGSPTSNTTALLDVIRPEMVCVCCCCGSDEYTDNVANMFPSQDFVDKIAPYTDKVYVTTIVDDSKEGYTSMNGNIIVYYDKLEKVQVRCSNNGTLFKDTDWFKNNRTLPDAWKSKDTTEE